MARDRRQIERPIERGVTATDDEQPLVAELVHLAYRVEHRRAFVGLDARYRGALGLERAAARRHDDELRLEYLALISGDAEFRIADALDRLHHLTQMKCRLEWLDLPHQRVGEPLPRHHRHARDVVNRLFGIELGTLSSDLVEDIDQICFNVEQAQLEDGEQSARAGADDEYVSLDRIGHACSLRPGMMELKGEGLAWADRPAKSVFGDKLQAVTAPGE